MNRPPLILALDAGTSVVKAVAFTADGATLAETARPNLFRTGPGGAVEQDMTATRRDAREVLAELISRLDGHPIAALAVTGQGDGTWLADAEGEPVAPAWLLARCARGADRRGGCRRIGDRQHRRLCACLAAGARSDDHLRRLGARGVRGHRPGGAGLLYRRRRNAGRGARDRRGGALSPDARDPGRLPRPAGAHHCPAGSRCGGCGDDRRRERGHIPRHGRLRRALGGAALR